MKNIYVNKFIIQEILEILVEADKKVEKKEIFKRIIKENTKFYKII